MSRKLVTNFKTKKLYIISGISICMLILAITSYVKYSQKMQSAKQEHITQLIKDSYIDGYLSKIAQRNYDEIQSLKKDNSLNLNQNDLINILNLDISIENELNDFFVEPVINERDIAEYVKIEKFPESREDYQKFDDLKNSLEAYKEQKSTLLLNTDIKNYGYKIEDQLDIVYDNATKQKEWGETYTDGFFRLSKEWDKYIIDRKNIDKMDWNQFMLSNEKVIGRYYLLKSGYIHSSDLDSYHLPSLSNINKYQDEKESDVLYYPIVELTDDGKYKYTKPYTHVIGMNTTLTREDIITKNFLFYDVNTIFVGGSKQSKDFSYHVNLYKENEKLLQAFNTGEKDYISITDKTVIEDNDKNTVIDITNEKSSEEHKDYSSPVIYFDENFIYQLYYLTDDKIYIEKYKKNNDN